MLEKMISEINKEIERTKEYYERNGWDNGHEKNLARINGMIKMLEIATGKSYTFDENGLTEAK